MGSARGDNNLTTLYDFDGNNGAQPWATLTLASDGNFYGVADQYGDDYSGTVFRMTPGGVFTKLHSFTGGSGGASPKGALLQGPDGALYGTTSNGGDTSPANSLGDGTIFKISLDGEFTTLAAFSGTNGSLPFAAPLVAGPDGNFYGTTAWGGVTGTPPVINGTVFRVSPAGDLKSLFTFDFTDGFSPYGGLVTGPDGDFIGVTPLGVAGNRGSIFKITTNGVLTTLVAFRGTNGDLPYSALLRGTDGNYYGTTVTGGATVGDPESVNAAGFGTLFKMTPDGSLTTLFSFARTNGSYPYATLVEDEKGNLYGTTASGGAYTNELFPGSTGYAGYGTIFRLAPNGTLTTLVSFDNTNGAQPFSGLTRGPDGRYYGTTIRGGVYGLGTIYSLDVPETSSLLPIISRFVDLTVECGATAVVDAQVSSRDGDALTIVWTVNGQAVQTNTVPARQSLTPTDLSFSAMLPLGTNTVLVTATGTSTNTASRLTTVTVVDTTPPFIQNAVALPHVLWPPDHRFVPINITAFVSDDCGLASWKIIRVSCNEPVKPHGARNSPPDWIITGDHTVYLRAERATKAPIRIYIISVQATDQAGNTSQRDLAVIVAKNAPGLPRPPVPLLPPPILILPPPVLPPPPPTRPPPVIFPTLPTTPITIHQN